MLQIVALSGLVCLCPQNNSQDSTPSQGNKEAQPVQETGTQGNLSKEQTIKNLISYSIKQAEVESNKNDRRFQRDKAAFDTVIRDADRSGKKGRLDPTLLRREFEVNALRHPYTMGNFSWQLLAGAEFSENENSFSSPTAYVRFIGDTAFDPQSEDRFSLGNWHSVVDVSFSSIPVQEGSMNNQFIESEKALTGSVGMDWYFYQHPQSLDGHHTQVGISGRVGLQSTKVEDDSDLTSDNEFWGVGLTVRTCPIFRYSDPNPPAYAYGTIMYGEYDTLEDHALTFDGMIRFLPGPDSSTDKPIGLFIGMRAIVNLRDGDDDLRFQIGVQDGLALLEKLFSLPKALFLGEGSGSGEGQ